MTKKDAIEQVRKAKLGHKKWISYAKAIHMGIPLKTESLPVIETECDFGKWYYRDGQIFSNIESFRSIEEPHGILHNTYMKLYKTMNEPVQTGLFVSKSKAERKKAKEMDELMDKLLQISEILINNLSRFEMDLKELSDDEFEKLQ